MIHFNAYSKKAFDMIREAADYYNFSFSPSFASSIYIKRLPDNEIIYGDDPDLSFDYEKIMKHILNSLGRLSANQRMDYLEVTALIAIIKGSDDIRKDDVYFKIKGKPIVDPFRISSIEILEEKLRELEQWRESWLKPGTNMSAAKQLAAPGDPDIIHDYWQRRRTLEAEIRLLRDVE